MPHNGIQLIIWVGFCYSTSACVSWLLLYMNNSYICHPLQLLWIHHHAYKFVYLLWASNYDCCIFPFRYFNLLLGDWSNFWCVIFILWSSCLTKLMHLFICQNVFLIFLGFYFLLKIIYSTEKKEWYNWGIVLRLKPKTPSPFCSCCLLCWAMTALAERHGFSTNSSQKFCLLFIVCLNSFILNKNVVNAWPVTANPEVEFL